MSGRNGSPLPRSVDQDNVLGCEVACERRDPGRALSARLERHLAILAVRILLQKKGADDDER